MIEAGRRPLDIPDLGKVPREDGDFLAAIKQMLRTGRAAFGV
jgi:hypothetical protein